MSENDAERKNAKKLNQVECALRRGVNFINIILRTSFSCESVFAQFLCAYEVCNFLMTLMKLVQKLFIKCWYYCLKVLISSIFYKQLFCANMFWATFLYIQLVLVYFWQRDIGAKAALKMIVKLSTRLLIPPQQTKRVTKNSSQQILSLLGKNKQK